MIDYEKLKEAVILCNAIHDYWFEVDFCTNTIDHNKINIRLICTNTDETTEFDSFDCLITTLKKLTEPKRAHKYIVGDEVWFLRICGTIDHSHVVEIDFDSNDMYLINGVRWFEEKDLYPTKQALIEAQITYWQSLLEPEKQIKPRTFKSQSSPITECDHDYKEKLDKSGRYFVNMCHKCGHHYPIALLKPESRQIQEAPFLGNLSREEIQRAVESVSKPAKEECQHESDGAKHIMNQASEGLSFTMNKCKKCGEFYR